MLFFSIYISIGLLSNTIILPRLSCNTFSDSLGDLEAGLEFVSLDIIGTIMVFLLLHVNLL